MFKKEYEIRFYEIDHKHRLKASVLINFLQDIAAFHAEKLGFGYSYITPLNLAWVLLRYKMKIFKWPQNMDKIIIKTWPCEFKKLSCPREFEIFAPNGEKLAVISSCWVLIDMTTRKPVIASKVLKDFAHLEKQLLDGCNTKVADLEKIDLKKEFEIRYDDIDINQHANNADYITWALEPLGFNFRSEHDIEELQIQYKKEAMFNDKITSKVDFDKKNLTSLHSIYANSAENDICRVQIKWKKNI